MIHYESFKANEQNLVKFIPKVPIRNLIGITKRMGFLIKKDNLFHQITFLAKIKSRWYLLHYKEVFQLYGEELNIKEKDVIARNKIAKMLEKWDMIKILNDIDHSYGYDLNEQIYLEFPLNVLKANEKNKFERISNFDIVAFNEELKKLNQKLEKTMDDIEELNEY